MVIESFRARFDYDPATGVLSYKNGKVAGSRKTDGYLSVMVNGVEYKVHVVIMAMVEGRFPEATIDHINGVKDDNRLENLRHATYTQNNVNRRGWAKSGAKGVRVNGAGRFRARIIVGGKHIGLGTYDTLEEASDAYKEAARRYYGEFVNTSI